MSKHPSLADMAAVVVVGAGLAGLAAAFEAARRGHLVTVLESRSNVGGRGTSTEVSGGPLNVGPHLLRRKGPLHVLLTKVSKVGIKSNRIGAGRLHRLTGKEMKPLALSSSTTRIVGTDAVERLELLRLRRTLRKAAKDTPEEGFKVWNSTHPEIIQAEYSSWWALSSWGLPDDDVNLAEASRIIDDALWKGGLLNIEHGWADLVGRLLAALDRLEVEVRSGATVDSISLRSDGTVRGVKVNGRSLPTDSVILAIPARVAADILEASGIDARPLSRVECIDATILDLDLDGAYLSHPAGSSMVIHDVDRDLFCLNTRFSGERGGGRMHLMAHHHDIEDPEMRIEDATNRIEEFLAERCLGWQDSLTMRRLTRSVTIHGSRKRRSRPAPDLFIERGIGLAGDWTDGGDILSDAAVASGMLVAGMLE